MATIEGLEQFLRGISAFGDAVDGNVNEAIRLELEACQREAADLVPVDSGQGRAVVMLPEAIDSKKDNATGGTIWRFGFITPRMRRTKRRGGAMHLFFVEFGTKFHPPKPPGTRTDKRGRVRKVGKGRRGSPARPAQPFFRPAASNLMRRVQEMRGVLDAIATAKRAAGLGE